MQELFGETPTSKPPEALARCGYVDLDVRGLFWLEPDSLQQTTELINSASMGTMLLAVVSRKREIEVLRGQLEGVIAVDDENERAELADAIEFGFLYGDVAAKKTAEACLSRETVVADELQPSEATEIDENLWKLLRSAISGIDTNSLGGLCDAFMRVRDVELTLCGSDVLSFMLASAQDHIADEFHRYRANSARELTPDEVASDSQNSLGEDTKKQSYGKLHNLRLQTLFYVGSLVGAYANTTVQQKGKDEVQIMRSAHPTGETVSVRLELERGESLDVLQYYMANKLRMRMYGGYDGSDVPRVHGLRVMHEGLQAGPNIMSMPLDLYEDEVSADIPKEDIRGVFIEETDAAGVKQLVLYDSDYLTEWRDDSALVRGFVTGDTCVGVFDNHHPMSEAMLQLARQHFRRKKHDIGYANDFNIPLAEERVGLQPMRRAKAAAILGVALLSEWAPELLAYAAHQPEHAHPANALVINVITVLAASVFGVTRRRLRAGEETIRKMDGSLQEQIDRSP
jgi:hypothetical protein